MHICIAMAAPKKSHSGHQAKDAPKKPKKEKRERLMQALENWDDIRFFLAIQRAGSLSAAASALAVTQPTCGRRLSALEQALGIRLFDRAPDGLHLTTEGAALLDVATRMEENANDLALRATARVEKLDGVVRIAMTELTALVWFLRILPSMRERYPGIRIECVLADTPADILGREADFAIRWRREGFRPGPGKVIAKKLGRVGFALFGGERYLSIRGAPKDVSHLAGHDVVLYEGSGYPGHDWMTSAVVGATLALTTPSIVCNLTAVSEGIGLGLFPEHVIRLQPTVRQLTQPVGWGWAWIVVHPDLQHVPRIRAVMDHVSAALRADLSQRSP
jgi:DNA-binding transcriptional LysR family regulator